MKPWIVMMIAAATAVVQSAMAQTTDGVPGDRLVVPLPDVSALSDAEAQQLAKELAQMNVITSECPEHDVTDAEWQLMNGTTDALMTRLGIDAVTYDRQYFRPAFTLMDDPDSCTTLGPMAPAMVARLEQMGGSTQPVTAQPVTAEPVPQAETPAE